MIVHSRLIFFFRESFSNKKIIKKLYEAKTIENELGKR